MTVRYGDVKMFRIDNKTKEILEMKCKINGVNESEYIRRLIVSNNISNDGIQQVKDLIYEISKIGNNINQITRKMNMLHFEEEDIQKIVTMQKTILNKMEDIKKAVGYGSN